METRFWWKKKSDSLSDEFFLLERHCFSKRYSIAPQTKHDFDAMFTCKSLIGEMRLEGDLIGMLFLDELIKDKLHYLRVVCVCPRFRRKGFGTGLLKKAVQTLGPKSIYLAFVTETEELLRIAKRAGGVLCDVLPSDVERELWGYNGKLANKTPGSSIEKYYRMTSGIEARGLYLVFSFG